MFIAPGWGDRLRLERSRLGLSQDAFVHRNTQRSYELEKSPPDVRYLAEAESRGLDTAFIVTGQRHRESGDQGEEARELLDCFDRLNRANQLALLQIARSMAGEPEPPPRVHASATSFRGERE